MATSYGAVRVQIGLPGTEVGREKFQLRFYSTLHCSADFGLTDEGFG